jgi:hypothetical protein
LLLCFFAVRAINFLLRRPFSEDTAWVKPSLAVVEICVIAASIPEAWRCIGTGVCPENSMESCLYYLFALAYLGWQAIKKIALAPVKVFKELD